MSLTRREFMKICSASAAGFGIARMFHPAVARAVSGALDGSRPPVLWVRGLACGNCSSALLDAAHPAIADVLRKMISLEFHPALMAAEGESALRNLFKIAADYKGKYFMVLEGAIPQAAAGRYALAGALDGREYTTRDLVQELAPKAAAVLAVGTCAAFGGVAASGSNPTQSVGLGEFMRGAKINAPLVNIAGCAPHPDWIVGTLAYSLELFATEGGRRAVEALNAGLDAQRRPLAFYGPSVHNECPHLAEYKAGRMARSFTSLGGCRHSLGCRGPAARADCASRRWNGGVNWCVDNAICTGCVEPDFPGALPFYKL